MTTTTLRPLGVDTIPNPGSGAAMAKDSPLAGSTPPAVDPSGRSDEPWHGTSVGYRCRRCRCELCRAEHAAWHRAYRARLRDAGPLTVDPVFARRRLQALMAMGWPLDAIAEQVGRTGRTVSELLNARVDRITLATDQTVRDVYQRLHMIPGPSDGARLRAAHRGFYAPLAWDNIDDPDEQPDRGSPDREDLIDPVVVERILSLDVVPATRSERLAVIARWLDLGRPVKALDAFTGWNVHRDLRTAARAPERTALCL